MTVAVPKTAADQWAYKANVATSRAPTSKGWAKYQSSNGWPKIPPRLTRLVGARIEDRITGKRGTVLRGSQNGWLVVEYDDQSMGTPSPGQLVVIGAVKRSAVKRPNQKDAQIRDLMAEIAELKALVRIAERERRTSLDDVPEDDDLPVVRVRWAA